MPPRIDLTGRQFGKLRVIGRAERQSARSLWYWLCQCECGNQKIVSGINIGRNTNSCGCIRNHQGALTRKHPLWRRWSNMIDRCTNPKNKDFRNYGGRGIDVCERWKHFPSFLSDMEASYFKGATLDRRDNDGNYCPENCRWASIKEQSNNTRKTIFLDTPWGRMTASEAAELTGVPLSRLSNRVLRGWPIERLFDGKMHKWSRRN